MISFSEGTCLAAASAHLDENETTVGTYVCLSHQAAVTKGQEFVLRCRLASIERRRLNFDVEVDDPTGPVSRGTHQGATVNLAYHCDARIHLNAARPIRRCGQSALSDPSQHIDAHHHRSV